MKKEKTQTLEEANGQAIREDFEALEQQEQLNQKVTHDPDLYNDENELIDQQIELNKDENSELKNNTDYLEYSAEVVGYENRETQWNAYRSIFNYIGQEDSVLDYGCGRGDFERFCQTEYQLKLDYLGIDMNQQLIDAGKKVYNNEVNLQCIDWFKLDKNIKKDWCINIGSNNLRYDGDTIKTDQQYLLDTIDNMIQHANKGAVVLLTSDKVKIEDGLISWNAGDILNNVLTHYDNVALDHSLSNEVFVLIIYKNEN